MKTRNCLPPVILMLASGFSHAQPLVTDKIFAPASFWYMPVPANTPLHPNSANYVRDFLRQNTAQFNMVKPQPAPAPPKPPGLLDQVRNYLKRTLGR
jgi:hypothetical protein